MKKLIKIFLVMVFALGLVGCNNKSMNYIRNGKYYDWIEIHNLSDDISLLNVSITDDEKNLNKSMLPDVIIKKDEYKVIYLTGGEKVDGFVTTSFKFLIKIRR